MTFGPLKTPQKKPDPKKTEKEEYIYTRNTCAKMLNKDPRTVKKRIEEAELKPADKVNGFDVYRLSDIALLCFIGEPITNTSYQVETLRPKERAEHFMAEKRELEVLEMRRELVQYDEASEKFADLARTFSKFFETFADDLEQTQLFTLEQMVEIRNLSDDQRKAFYTAEF